MALLANTLVGSISMKAEGEECELRGFYVYKKYQYQGLGKRLWQYALDFSKGRDITLDTYASNSQAIEMYKRWGFEIDEPRGIFYVHYPEWPDNISGKSIYMRLRQHK